MDLDISKNSIYDSTHSLWNGIKYKNACLMNEYRTSQSQIYIFSSYINTLFTLLMSIYFIILLSNGNNASSQVAAIIASISVILGIILILHIINFFYLSNKVSLQGRVIIVIFILEQIISIFIEQMAYYIIFTDDSSNLGNLKNEENKQKLILFRIRLLYFKLIKAVQTYLSIYDISILKVLIHILINLASVLIALSTNNIENISTYLIEIVSHPAMAFGILFFYFKFDTLLRHNFITSKREEYQMKYFKGILNDSQYSFLSFTDKEKVLFYNRKYSEEFNKNALNAHIFQIKKLINTKTGKSISDYIYEIKSTNGVETNPAAIQLDNDQNISFFPFDQNRSKGSFYKLGIFSMDLEYFQIFVRESIHPFCKDKIIDMMIINITKIQYAQKLSTEMEVKQNLFSKIAHEFKSPLICLTIMLDNMKKEMQEDRIEAGIKIAEDVQRLSSYIYYLIDDIIHYSSTQNLNSEIPIKFESRVITEDLVFTYGLLEVLLKVKNKDNGKVKPELFIQPEIENHYVNIDYVRLRQIIINLLSNSVKFTKFGYIKIIAKLVEEEEPFIEIEVVDSGVGMSEEISKSLFKGQKIIDLKVNKSMNQMGTGTGLNVVKSICDLMNIKIYCKSEPNKGTSTKLKIKISSVEELSSSSTLTVLLNDSIKEHLYTTDFQYKSVIVKSKSSITNLNNILKLTPNKEHEKASIIVCDDSNLIRKSTMNLMESIQEIKLKYNIISCYDGAEVLLKIIDDQSNGNLIKIVFLDEQMDYLNGSQTVSLIKNFQKEKKIKSCFFVSISAFDDENIKESLIEKGFDMVLQKPLNLKSLTECFKFFKILK